MDHIISKESDFVVDLENCTSTNEESRTKGDALFAVVGDSDSDELSKAENGVNLNSKIKDGEKISTGNLKVFIDKGNLVDKKAAKEKRKSTSAKKHPKPPRPPRGLSLDAADQKLIKEIAELAMLKRARIERLKALKKMKAAKPSSTSASSNGSFLALLFTVFFFFVLFFQGESYRSSAVSSPESLRSVGLRQSSFITVQDNSNPSTSSSILVGSRSSNLVEQQSTGSSHSDSLELVTS